MTEYRSMTTRALFDALGQADRCPDLDLLRECLARREELTPLLLDALEEGVDPAWDPDDPRVYLDVHAGLLLCAYREPAALPVFGRAFRDPDRDELLEWFTFDLPAAYGAAAIPMLSELMNDAQAHDYARSTAMAMLVAAAQIVPQERERIVDAFRALLPELTEEGTLPPDTPESELWTWIALSLSDLDDKESRPQIQAFFRADMIDEWVLGDEQTYLDDWHRKRPAPGAFDLIAIYEQLHEQAAEEAKWREEAAERQRKLEQQREKEARRRAERAERAPRRHEQDAQNAAPQLRAASDRPKIGRNDPCWCGSGKKYKRCHWRQDHR